MSTCTDLNGQFSTEYNINIHPYYGIFYLLFRPALRPKCSCEFSHFFQLFSANSRKTAFSRNFSPLSLFPIIIFPLTNYQKYSTIQISLLMTKKIVDCSVSSLEFVATLQRDNVRRERPIRLFPAGS